MKRITLVVTILYCLVWNGSFSQSLSVNTTGAPGDPSAIVDISSVNKGMLTPRMTVAQRNTIVNPATGLIIWCIDCDEFQVFNGIIWKNMSGYAACVSPLLPFVKICNQTWMARNLDVDKYRNGDPIPKVTDNATWAGLTTGAYCYYNNDSATYSATYGKMYNWHAVTDPRGLAPAGWHVPSDAEWNILVKCIDPSADTTCFNCNLAGGAMKEIGTAHWLAPNTGATNSSGFTGLPGGGRYGNGTFGNINEIVSLWSSTPHANVFYAYLRTVSFNNVFIGSYFGGRQSGYSVRCLRD